MIETLLLTVILVGIVSATFFGEWTGVQPVPLVCTVVGAAALAVVDKFVGAWIAGALNAHRKVIPITIGVIVILAAVYVAAALNLTGPASLDPNETLRRAVYPAPGTYNLAMDSDGPVHVTIQSQNQEDTMMHTSTVLYEGNVDGETVAFTVPEESLVTFFNFHSKDGVKIRSATFEGESIPLGYKLLPSFIARRLQGLFANENAIQRTVFFEDGMKLFKRSPFVGLGMGGFENGIKGVQSFYYETKYAHNHYIQALIDTGVVGLVLFLLVLASSAFVIIKARYGKDKTTEPGMLPALGTALVFMAGHAITQRLCSQPIHTSPWPSACLS